MTGCARTRTSQTPDARNAVFVASSRVKTFGATSRQTTRMMENASPVSAPHVASARDRRTSAVIFPRPWSREPKTTAAVAYPSHAYAHSIHRLATTWCAARPLGVKFFAAITTASTKDDCRRSERHTMDAASRAKSNVSAAFNRGADHTGSGRRRPLGVVVVTSRVAHAADAVTTHAYAIPAARIIRRSSRAAIPAASAIAPVSPTKRAANVIVVARRTRPYPCMSPTPHANTHANGTPATLYAKYSREMASTRASSESARNAASLAAKSAPAANTPHASAHTSAARAHAAARDASFEPR